MKAACIDHFTPEAQAALTDMQCRVLGSPIDTTLAKARKGANQINVDALLDVMSETMRLCAEGHQIEGIEIRNGMPLITLYPSTELRHMALQGRHAMYVAHGCLDNIRRATGELLGRACRVQWIEQQ